MKYEDLLSLPYQQNGRVGTDSGTDCYGYVIELTKRNGTPLKDFVFPSSKVSSENAEDYYRKINIREITESEAGFGDIVQCEYDGNLHIAFMLDKQTVTHMTYSGARVSPLISLKNRKFGRII